MIDKRLWYLFEKPKALLKKTLLYQWLALICNLMIFINIKRLIDSEVSSLFIWLLMQIAYLMLKLHFLALSKSYANQTANDFKLSLRQKLFHHLMSQNELPSSRMPQLITEGVEQLEVYFALYLPQFFYAMLAPFTLFILLSFYNLKVSLLLLVLVPAIPMSIVFVQKVAKRILGRYWQSYANLNTSFLDKLQGLKTLKSFQVDGIMHEKMNEDAESFRKQTMRVLVMQLNSISVMDLVAYGGSALAILLAYREYLNQNMTLGILLMFVLVSSEFFIPMRLLGSYFHIAMNGAAASEEMFLIFEDEINQNEGEYLKEFESIHLENVSYAYGSRYVLENINMEIPKFAWVSIVGESGSGKSTLLSILSKRIHADGVFVGQQKLSDLSFASVHQKILLIGAHSYLFKGTVFDNLAMSGCEDLNQMRTILEKLDLWETLAQRGGLEAEILEHASNLSGGEKQRLLLARGLLFDPDVFILDEITSNVDAESEVIMMDVLNKLQDKTIIMVSHRLKNVVHSDNIYVLSQGGLIEQGTHDMLLSLGGQYAKLYQTQVDLENFEKVSR